jgi:hypothetical protein
MNLFVFIIFDNYETFLILKYLNLYKICILKFKTISKYEI